MYTTMLCWEQAGVQIRTHYPGRKRRGWPGGRHATPTELKMRSRITTISVNFPTFPANQSFRPTAESMRPRAKSFISSISQIEANRQKFVFKYDVRGQEMPQIGQKWPNHGFFARGRKTREGGCLQCINEMCAMILRFEFACTEWRSMTSSPSFSTKTLKRHFSDKILNNRVCIDITAVRPNIRAILAPLESDVSRGLSAGSIFTIVRRVYILRIQRCGT